MESELDRYLERLASVLGHADRRAGLRDYCRGLMLPIHRKSVEPLAAHIEPQRVRAKHQSLHHFVAKSAWSDAAVLREVRAVVQPVLGLEHGAYWIIDDTGLPKQGRHSVGVARQYCGQLGKTENCQVAVSLSLASDAGSLPIQWRLYLPETWTSDPARRAKAGVPETLAFATKTDIALAQVEQALAEGVPRGVVLADPAYGDSAAFRDRLSEWGLSYAVGVRAATAVWLPDSAPAMPAPGAGRGRARTRLHRNPEQPPVSLKELAQSLPEHAWQTVAWREGTNGTLQSRFAAVRVQAAHGGTPRAQEWALIEWPEGDAEPLKYFLCSLPADTPLERLVHVSKMRWRIERDYRELKQEFGLGQYEGRNWRGVHHHATLCIAAYGFLLWQRLSRSDKKKFARPQAPVLPESYRPRGSRANATACAGLDCHAAADAGTTNCPHPASLPMLRAGEE
ncbi:IS701 family transposase [Extensimonas vulgaris]|uniref:SRSO17 transposase n=5 Tax=Extensimonas vulgaris TaxID=1031594 RepID=A0A369ABX8_9BURK|nr:IS701 family transposase [Extensimonas vulgaris]RCX06862.1 SRSO17 transposase [Extensimonas vulgaris]TWI41604.1 SRSO17 transposase [Extensimonas vulgaris]TXD12405.1 IS701 family transposase [Extensimonas vulgaris]